MPKFQKGVSANPNGRPPGVLSPVKRELIDRMQEAVYARFPDIKEYDPAVELALIGCDPLNDIAVRAAAHAKVLPYIHAQKTPIKIETNINIQENKITLVDAMAAMLEQLPAGDIIDAEIFSPSDDGVKD